MEKWIVDLLEMYKDDIGGMLADNAGMVPIVIIIGILFAVVLFLSYFFLAWLCIRISRKVFRHIEKRKGKSIELQFTENLLRLIIIVLFIIMPLAGDQIKQSILGSAAVIAAIVGFASQDAIKDIMSGLLISVYKPFDLGDRIELEDGTAGIVESITMRHVVLVLIDTVRLVVPNSKLNSSTIKNLSFDYVPRSVEFSFPVHYNSDIEKTKDVIFQAVKESPYSIPGKKSKSGDMIYGPVYFIALMDSALKMKVTVYYEPPTATEVLKDDINTRVFAALGEAGIVVPYPHANIIIQD
ncbi:mechanosensitive ion channel family protein [Butyrivibrio sp. YAB3001]|uniref:mechanosensitive ion channel family protein n=1 Tax=Butyrivibrio sp. YAB3001 TaxID=1520812 RepID=UPI0008F690CA|nr:mechanosensitive ion channel family protein [Butyrivibrio sp. YAB3001]SFB73461.1 Small-conductance mechanosensitive channel [Butyrivibrio sp. YAB3001]